jgi:hypothetical protein
MSRSPGVAAFIAGALVLAGGDGRAGRAPFLLAVLRQDGVLVPFASYDGRWRNTWPTPRASVDVPITFEDVPRRWWPDGQPRADWTLWRPDGSAQALRVRSPAWFVAQCQGNVGLKTDYVPPGPVAGPEATPFPKEGLAVAGPEEIRPRIAPIRVVHESDEAWRVVASRLGQRFDEAEEAAIRDQGLGGWRHPMTAAERRRRALAVEAVYRGPAEGPRGEIGYVEAVRRYDATAAGLAPPGRPPCDLLTFARGWFRWGADGPTDVVLRAVVTDCYRWNAVFMLPLGVLRLDEGPSLWVVQASSWTGEAYLVLEPRPPERERVLIETSGGMCR